MVWDRAAVGTNCCPICMCHRLDKMRTESLGMGLDLLVQMSCLDFGKKFLTMERLNTIYSTVL